ncbi:hypothetical protein [Neoroseomonas lacus]|uniref:Uncharacterized protein n=1 Tax=Neoroseomonas lacus TaxID=287609 RepID=A0A917KR96_9PROT|nr:hypothetical protein [Neoroseomonas lacus]GGJ26238.1 hypothetical protein GCM10011320_37120 [Neoroseomonas lacus]
MNASRRHCPGRAARWQPRAGAALLLALLAAPAAAQAPDWRAAAPALPLRGPQRPITTPVAIGGAGWGPWRHICREQTDRPGRAPTRDCLTVAAVQPEPGGTRLVLVQDRTGLRMSVLRGTEGRISEFTALRADGTALPHDEVRDGLLAAWRDQFATLSLERRRIVVGEDFPMAIDGSSRGGVCRAAGLDAIAQRAVLVARCAVELAGRLRGGDSEARVAIFAHIAVDVASGVVLAQGYATRIETFTGNGRSKGVVVTPSRVILE